ncbi:hypothetical protein [Prevotella dentalis]|uniref:hypothetical protein n=1 Tax=Prevotella dentalis TaxID=52227 RepID=UPI002657BACE|nr:hypothetical protein [Prevotella dentalis]MCF2638153.1 hypothetical protein [Prevotella dentalis]
MTKHLRLIMLSLLAMICLGGYSQSEVIIWQEDWTGAKADQKVNKINTNYSAQNDGTTIYNEKLAGGVAPELLLKKSDTFVVTIENLKGCSGELTLTYKSNNEKITSIKANDKPVTFTLNGNDRTAKITINEGTTSLKLEFSCKANTRLDNFKLVGNAAGESQKKTSLSFPGEGVTLINGKLANGNDFNGYTATEKDNVPGTIVYAASGDGVATVDRTTGEVTVDPNVSGTTKITATFTPNEEKTYAGSTASYTITNIKSKYYAKVADLRKDLNNGTLTANDEVAVKLTDAKVLYVNQWTSNKVDHTQYFVREGNAAISFYDTDINMSKSAVVNGTFMGKIGSLTGLLVLTKNNNTNPAGLQVKTSTKPAEPIEISTDDIANYVCDLVTVKGATVIGGTDCALFNGNNLMPLYYNKFFPRTTSLEAPYDNANVDLTSAIVLTYVNDKNDKKELVYELAPTDKYTLVYNLSEESVNTIAAKTDIAVSLKRTFYKDGEWNTLCLPFAVADAKTAFDNAELREVDTEKSNGNTIVFKEATAIEAGKPYLIKWANSSAAAVNVEKKFEGVTLVAAATPVEVNNGGISFNGFYKMTEARELGASVAAIGAGNKLFKVIEGEMKGFRAAFVLSSGAEATKYNVVIDGTATGIEDLVIDGVKANGRVYNLNGQYVGNSLNGLQPGLYIQNGKKIIVK